MASQQNGLLALLTTARELVERKITRVVASLIVLIALIIVISMVSWSLMAGLITVAGFVLSIVSLAIMIGIANSQNDVMADQNKLMKEQGNQLESLDKLNDELQARKAERERVKALFLASDKRPFTCVMPVEYRKRPLPTIAAGDYYAWHVVQNFVDDVIISMKLTNREREEDKPVNVPQGNVIFLCSPQANPPLDEFAPWIRLIDTHVPEPEEVTNPKEKRGNSRLKAINLPVWFGCRNRVVRNPETGCTYEWDEKVIFYHCDGRAPGPRDTVAVRRSPVEEEYVAADRLKDNQEPVKTDVRKHDRAIIIRASRKLFDTTQSDSSDEKIFVVAGIHQHGTWIAGDFLQQFCRGKKPEVDRIFKSEVDFAVVLYGQFNEDTLTVESSEVHGTDIWQFIGDKWERVPKGEGGVMPIKRQSSNKT
jgi:hypothetical protein